jgi:hypothetical protein
MIRASLALQEETMANNRPTGKRERIDTTPDSPGGSRFIRRDANGRFTSDQVDVGRSLAADQRQQAKHQAPKGMKDRGD